MVIFLFTSIISGHKPGSARSWFELAPSVQGPDFLALPVEGPLPRFPRVEEVTNRGVIALAEGCPRLHVVHIGHSLVSAGGVRALAFHCRELQVLFLTGCL